ncbi:Uncharacterized sugar transferase EpsL [Desulfovibrionales bacterium]
MSPARKIPPLPLTKPGYPFHRRKRTLDLILTLLTLPLWLPLLGLAALSVWLCLGRPILFRQQRPGLYGRPFVLVKLRTMTDNHDAEGRLLPDAERLPLIGRLLRHSSLDELPELFHVLAGTMSLVGPRPLLMSYLDYYTPEHHRRHGMPPGITGLAQIYGRNLLAWEERFALDIWYVNHWSLSLDLAILAKTLCQTITGHGVTTVVGTTSEKFHPADRR